MAAKLRGAIHMLWGCALVCAGLTEFLRIDGGDKTCEGVVELRHEDIWRPLCRASIDSHLQSMICRELQCGAPIPERRTNLQTLSNASLALNVSCPLMDSLRHCNISIMAAEECDGAASISCADDDVGVRLSGGGGPCTGRVEVLLDGIWGAVCDDDWDALDAQVTCRQLGCGSALTAYKASYFGGGSAPIHLDDVSCDGSETFLWQCPSSRKHDCTEKEHAGVLCTGHREVRLSGGPHHCSGRLEVLIDGVWATVCESHWYEEDSMTVCQSLGCGRFVNLTKHEHSLSTSVTLICSNWTSLRDCRVYPKNPYTCHQAKAVGIVCSGDFNDRTSAVTPFSPTGPPPTSSGSTHQYFIVVCTLLLGLFLISILIFITIICRLQMKQKSSQPNLSLTRHNDYRDYRPSVIRPTQPPDDTLQIPVLYTGPPPPSPHTRTKEPVPASIPSVPPAAAAMSDEDDYDFSTTPPKPLATFHTPVEGRGSSSTSSGEQNWYENYKFQQEGADGLTLPPQSYDGSSEYDDINSLSSV